MHSVPDRIYADLAVLERGVEDFQHVLNAYRNALAKLDAHLRVSLSEWTGDARHAYQVFHDEWREDARELAERLAQLRQVIADSHGNYGRSRATNLRMWNL